LWFKRTCNHLWNSSVTKREKRWMIPIDHRYVLFVVIKIRSFPHDWLIHRVCNKSNTTSVICGAGTAHSSGAHEFTPGFSGIRVARSLVFCVVICTSLFVLLSDFLFAVVLCVPLRFTASDYPLYICIFKLFFLPQGRMSLTLSLSPLSSTLLVLRRLALH
jgi:hypothetical protein